MACERGFSEKGFTLLEIIIAIMILTIISVMTAMNIQHSIKVKTKVERDLDDYAEIRDALVIITRDVNLAFHWVDIDDLIKQQLTQEAVSQGRPPPFPSPPQTNPNGDVPPARITGFVGDDSSMTLTTLSHIRTVQNSAESDQAKVSYYLKDVRAVEDGKSTQALIRRESPVLDGDYDHGTGQETVLLEHVKSLKFRYLGGDDKEWATSWKSVDGNDDVQNNHFPDAVEITITTDNNNRKITLSTVAAVHMPNNDPFSANASPSPGAAGYPGGMMQQATPPPGQPL